MAFLYPRLTIRKHTYYIRVSVPKRLINIVKKRNIVYSLQTKDYQEALYKVREESYKIDKLFKNYEAKKRRNMLKDKTGRRYLEEIDIDKVMKARWVELLDIIEHKAYQIQKGTITFEQLAFFKPECLDVPFVIDEVEDENGNLIEVEYPVISIYEGTDLQKGTYFENPSAESRFKQLHDYVINVLKVSDAEWTIPEIRDGLEINDINLGLLNGSDFASPEDNKNASWLMRFYACMIASDRELKRYIQSIIEDTDYKPKDLYIARIISAARKAIDKSINQSFQTNKQHWQEYIEKWKAYRTKQGIASKTINTDADRVVIMLKLLKHTDVSKIRRKDIKELELQLKDFPCNYQQRYGNKYDMWQAMKLAVKKKEEKGNSENITLSDPSIRNWMITLNTFFNYLCDEEILSENVIAHYKCKVAIAPKGKYSPFTDDDLHKIFNPKTYPLKTDDKDAYKFWCPLIALAVGCRVNEVAQLDVKDVIFFGGIQTIMFTEETLSGVENNKKLKNETSCRNVPVPDILINLGFLDYVNYRAKKNKVKLFELTYTKDKGYGNQLTKFFADYTQEPSVNVWKLRKKVFHSFRHTWKNFSKNAGISKDIALNICGWEDSDKSSYAHYGKLDISLQKLKQAINSIDLSYLHLEDLIGRTADDIVTKPMRTRRPSEPSVLGNSKHLKSGQKIRLIPGKLRRDED